MILLILLSIATHASAGVLPSTSSLSSSTSKAPESADTCDLKRCQKKEGYMCLCQRVALASVSDSLTTTDSGMDDRPYPGYLRTNYLNDLQNHPSSTICHAMVVSKQIDVKCLVSCSIMEQYIRAASGQDAMVCMKAVEEAELVGADGEMLTDVGEEDALEAKEAESGASKTSIRL